jgi:hypothetical protein
MEQTGQGKAASRLVSWFLVALIVPSLTGCAAMRIAARKAQNNGFEVRAGYPETVAALESVLQDQGYAVKTVGMYKGAEILKARQVSGVRESEESLKSIGKQVARNVALGVLGSPGKNKKKNVKTGTTEVIYFEVSTKWDETTWEGPVPGTLIVAPSGSMCDKSGREYTNCTAISDFQFSELVNEAKARLSKLAPSGKPAIAGAPADPAGALYAEAAALYAAGNYDASWQKAYAALQVNPQHWQSWHMIGNCQYAKGDKAGAIQSYNQSLAINPDNPSLRAWVQTLQSQ